MQEGDMQRLAALLSEAIKGKQVREQIHTLRTEFSTLQYT
jgi:hypothetical protein